MSDDEERKQSLVAISDVFGLGSLAKSKAFERLVSGVLFGVGEGFHTLLGSWKIKRDLRAAAIGANEVFENLPRDGSVELDLGGRFNLRVKREAERKQLNREEIAMIALNHASHQLGEARHAQDEGSDHLVADWLNHYWHLAENVSDEQMKVLWAKVLLRKSVSPNDFSVRSLHIVSQLSKNEAQMIEKLAPFVIEFDTPDATNHHFAAGILWVLEQYQGTFAVPEEHRKKFHDSVLSMLPKVDNVALDAAGIIQSVNGWASDFTIMPVNEIGLKLGNQRFILADLPDPSERYKESYSIGAGRGFTREGCEIARIVNSPPDAEYLRLFRQTVEAAGCRLLDVIDQQPSQHHN